MPSTHYLAIRGIEVAIGPVGLRHLYVVEVVILLRGSTLTIWLCPILSARLVGFLLNVRRVLERPDFSPEHRSAFGRVNANTHSW